MNFNPKVKDFLENNPDKGMLGFAWSLWWRWVVLVLGIELILGLIFLLITFSNR